MPKLGERVPIAERLWRKVTRADGCWLWTGARCPKGYGSIGLGGYKGGHIKAHRLSWQIKNGPIPEGMCVLHRCDVPSCVNPEHLFLGTVAENNRDRERKGRSAPVQLERHPNTKLTNAQVLEIYRRSHEGSALVVLATEYGVSASVIGEIKQGRSWSALTGAAHG